MKRTILISATLTFGFTLSAAAGPLVEPARCFKEPKRIRLLNQKTLIRKITIAQGNQVLLETDQPDDKLGLNCLKTPSDLHEGPNWSVAREEQKGVMATFVPDALVKAIPREVEIRSTRETPYSRTVVKVAKDGRTISIADDQKGSQTLTIQCSKGGLKIFSTQPGKKDNALIFDQSAHESDDPATPPSVPAGIASNFDNKGACRDFDVAFDAQKGELVAPAQASNSSKASPGTTGGTK